MDDELRGTTMLAFHSGQGRARWYLTELRLGPLGLSGNRRRKGLLVRF